jgi:CO dehydrogenase maturation factor
LIDCEAGLEIVNRLVIQSVEIILIVTDLSIRGIDTAESIRSSAQKFTNYKEMGVILNKVKGDISTIEKRLKEREFVIIGHIPEDQNIINFDLVGVPIIDLQLESESYFATRKIVQHLLE